MQIKLQAMHSCIITRNLLEIQIVLKMISLHYIIATAKAKWQNYGIIPQAFEIKFHFLFQVNYNIMKDPITQNTQKILKIVYYKNTIVQKLYNVTNTYMHSHLPVILQTQC